jgi:NAD(P)-dependent dehydrogenase (short-subunit alcohol dehydrogenase family)
LLRIGLNRHGRRFRLRRHQGRDPLLRQHLDPELKGRRIRVNVVSPGPIATPGLDSFADDATKAQLTALVPLGRIGEADEIAKAALFLASDDASFVAGAELFVDGGPAQV